MLAQRQQFFGCPSRSTNPQDTREQELKGIPRLFLFLPQVVIGGCHSLMDVDGVLHGDPLEVSALEGIRWDWNASCHTARPRRKASASKNGVETVAAADGDESGSGSTVRVTNDGDASKGKGEITTSDGDSNSTANEYDKRTSNDSSNNKGSSAKGAKQKGVKEEEDGNDGVSVSVWRRYAFSSQLQRMSVIAEVSGSDALANRKKEPEVRHFRENETAYGLFYWPAVLPVLLLSCCVCFRALNWAKW